MKNNSTARGLAFASLLSFCKNGRYSNLEVDAVLRTTGAELSAADRGLYTRLVYGVVERLLTLDHAIGEVSTRPLSDIDPATLTALRMGVYQLLYMDRVPDHAAVSETVELVPHRSRGFVNGVLRSFQRAGKKFSLPEGDMSIKYSVSPEICALLSECWGEETAESILAASFDTGRVCLRINTLRLTTEDAIGMLPDAERSAIASEIILLPSLTEAARDGIGRGLWFVQDEASRIATEVLDARPGERIADVCAAPGGKSFSAAIDMENRGEIFSFDLHKNKLSLIRSGAERLGLTVIRADARDGGDPDASLAGSCDRVICDAPCSGLGVLSKKPEIRYKDIRDVNRLPEVQLRVLRGAASYVKPGGVLLYSTCTLNRHENEEVVRRFLAGDDRFTPEDFAVTPLLRSGDGMLTLLPHITGSDGFFIAKLRART